MESMEEIKLNKIAKDIFLSSVKNDQLMIVMRKN